MITTDIPYLETHLNIALSLYKQRVNCLTQFYVDSTIQQAIEKRLLIHLHVLANSISENEPEPKDDDELFVYVSRMILSPNKENQKNVLLFSKKLLTEYISPQGLIDAFCLFYNEEIEKLLSDLFEANKELRETILTIWNFTNKKLPIGILNQSELQQHDSNLQAAVLIYHSDQADVSIDVFQKYYDSLISDVQRSDISFKVLHAALWGGMLGQDKNIIIAIRRAIELETDETNREKYLRLAALYGGNNFIPVFKSISENKPELASYLISLVGTTESVKELFSMLQNPRTSLSTIPAWRLLTGQELKSIPLISLVEEVSPNNLSEEKDDIPLIADIESAQTWINKKISNWTENARYILGDVCNKENLLNFSFQLSGKVAKDVFDLMALQFNTKINLRIESWILDRNEMLDELSSTHAVSIDNA